MPGEGEPRAPVSIRSRILEAPDLDAALGLAAKASVACKAPVEVRPFQEDVG